MVGIIGTKIARRIRGIPQISSGILPMDDIELDTPEPMVPRTGMFGADKIKRNTGDNMRLIGATLSDIGSGLRGGPRGNVQDFLDKEAGRQDQADYEAYLGGLDLDPDTMEFALSNPKEFQAARFKDAQGAQEKARLEGIIGDLNLTPEAHAAAMLNPTAFMEQAAKSGGTTQTDTFKNPLTGEWDIKPQLGTSGDSIFVNRGDGNPDIFQRPPSFDEIEGARAAKEEEANERRRLTVSERNARTAERNAGRRTEPFSSGGIPEGLMDDPNSDPIDWSPQRGGGGNGLQGGRVIKIGIGQNGEWVREDDDGEMVNGIPAPMFTDLVGDEKSWGPAIRAENKIIDEVTTGANALRNRADLANEFLTITEEGDNQYITGDPTWLALKHPGAFATQWMDDRGDRLDKINKELTIDMGQGMKGAFSDADRVFLQRGVSSRLTREESNIDFAKRQMALANRADQYDSWLRNYRAVFKQGTLKEAQRYWDDYKKAQPVFDKDGKPRENVPTITQWFAGNNSGGISEPFNRKVNVPTGKGKSAAEASDDEVLKKLGLK